MRLRNKITIILLSLLCLIVAVAYLGSQLILNKSYLDLEHRQAIDNLQRIDEAIQQLNVTVDTMTNNWAVWDDTYNFVVGKNKAYKKINLVVASFASTDADMIFYFNNAGDIIAKLAVNPERTKEIPVTTELNPYLAHNSPLVHQTALNQGIKGLLSTPSGILLVAARPIVTSNGQGPIHGTLMMAKYLSDTSIKKVANTTKVNFFIIPLRHHPLSSQYQSVLHSLESNNTDLITQSDDKSATGYHVLYDIFHNPIAIVKANLPRDLYRIGTSTIRYYNIGFLGFSILLILTSWLLLQKLLVNRLEHLKDQIGNVDLKNDYFDNLLGDTNDEIASVKTLYHQATHDPLTGLANRNLLEQVFNNRLTTVNAEKSHIALLFLDIDHFKRINDCLGHEVGDGLLVAMAKKLNSSLREKDLAVRLGGDEFVVMLTGTNQDHIKIIVDRIFKSFLQPTYVKDHELYLSSSMGISIYPNDGKDIATLLKNADIAMYHAKECGRNHHQYYSIELNRVIQEQNAKEAELQRAIDNKELTLWYQPIYNIITNKIISLEALIRWQHPKRGLLPASEIIPLAEKSGLIIPIGKWVLDTACQQARSWQLSGLPKLPIAINISILQTKNSSIERLVTTALNKTNLDPHFLELELTETSYFEVTEKILSELHYLKKLGIQLVVDDFGVGYSSLGYLRRLPISKLKIDRSFISDILTNPDDRTITLAIIGIAHQLDLQVIAEGVETKEQYDFLKINNIDAVQGHYLSPPLEVTDCEELLESIKKVDLSIS